MSRLIAFALGAYGGLYVAQNFEVPRIPGPTTLWEKVKEMFKEFEKKDR
ncbi:unnamed protein product [Lymnaea stagnalis]|uniref:Uncharacterized protein n=1 Tax=Lymnaea stagnalis TaxID=6523 RepID=A0AAV2HPF4_LYMST